MWTFRRSVEDPWGRRRDAAFALTADGSTAFIEVASASGHSDTPPDPWAASTVGTGQLVSAAIACGARHIVIAAGGSATTDGGAGAIKAIRASGGLRGAGLTVVCDVRTPFESAAHIFAPQKGADPGMVARLSERLQAQARSLPRDPRGVPCSGAAGGLAGGLWAALDAELVAGGAWVLDCVGFDQRLTQADLVVTGEGKRDPQSWRGKVVGEVASRSQVPVIAVVGSQESDADEQASQLAGVIVASTLPELTAAGRVVAVAAAGFDGGSRRLNVLEGG